MIGVGAKSKQPQAVHRHLGHNASPAIVRAACVALLSHEESNLGLRFWRSPCLPLHHVPMRPDIYRRDSRVFSYPLVRLAGP